MKIGDKVVCVDDSPPIKNGTPHDDCPDIKSIIKNSIYVINGITELNLKLVGFPVTCPACGTGVGWRKYRFRLLDELKQQAAVKQSQ